MRTLVLERLLFFPVPGLAATPARAELGFDDVFFETEDGLTLHGWWIPTEVEPALGHVLLFHGNAGNIGHRVLHAELLTDAGFDVFVFDYRGFGRSEGAPSEVGTHRDARAALRATLQRPGVRPDRIVYLGVSLGGAVALALAVESPPRGLVLQSTFTSVRDVAAIHYSVIPRVVVPDAYPSRERIGALRSPLLVLHGDSDRVIPLSHGKALLAAAPEPKRLRVFPGLGHDDLIAEAGAEWADVIAEWMRALGDE